jgi:hypothetical protein
MTDIEKNSRVRTDTGKLGTVRNLETKPDGTTYAYVDLDGERTTPDGLPFNVIHLEVMLGD